MVEGEFQTFANYNVSVSFDDTAKKIRLIGDVSPFEYFYYGFIGHNPLPSHLGEFVNWGKEYPQINGRTGYLTFDFPIDCVPAVEYGRYCVCFKIKDSTLYQIVSIVTKRGGVSADGSSSGARKAIESLYRARCSITETRKTLDPVTKRVTFTDVVTVKNEPCRLSFSSVANAVQGSEVANVAQVVKLFIRPELTVLAGSKIEVTQNGVTSKYVASGKPAVYSNHQEIVLTIGGDKA